MKHILHKQNQDNEYKIAILIKEAALSLDDIEKFYVNPLIAKGISKDSIITFGLEYNEHNKAPAKFCKEYLITLSKALEQLKVSILLVADSTYFKILTKVKKVEPSYGYILDSSYGFKCVVTTNYQALFYNPDLKSKIEISIDTVSDYILGTYTELGSDIIHSEAYPKTFREISTALDSLHKYEALTCDIEAFSLDFDKAGIGTIAFAWDQNNGVAFCVDYLEFKIPKTIDKVVNYGCKKDNHKIKELLLKFFKKYKGKIIYHNIGYDAKVLLYELFMSDLLDQKGLLNGLEEMTKNIACTKIISYLATNSCAGNSLGLKQQSHEYAGDYAEDVKDIRKTPINALLKYNLTDCLCTWYTYNKNMPILIKDDQLDIYNKIFIPSVKVLLQTELSGMPLDFSQVLNTDKELTDIRDKHLNAIKNSKLIKMFNKELQTCALLKKNASLKKLVKTIDQFEHVVFNPNSSKDLAKLLYEFLGFEITDTTDTGLPATGGKIIKKKLNQFMLEHNLTEEDIKND